MARTVSCVGMRFILLVFCTIGTTNTLTEFYVSPPSQSGPIGEDYTFSCKVIAYDSDTVPYLIWSKDFQDITNTEKYEVKVIFFRNEPTITVTNVLTILNATKLDSGTYKCTDEYSILGSFTAVLDVLDVEPTADRTSTVSTDSKPANTQLDKCDIKPRRYDVIDLGMKCYFRGWADGQSQGSNNDYCRVVGLSSGKQKYFSCALAGTAGESEYNFNSPNASDVWFDIGYDDTWYMKDEDGDGKDDYCRCVGTSPDTFVSCMKSGETGFIGHYDFTPSDATKNCRFIKVNPFIGPP